MVKNIQKIRERRDTIIDVIVTAFLEDGEPVSSGYVARNCGLGISPATVRNIMKELEEEWLLSQPHKSAGRIPTVKCYRYYVRNLMPHINLSEKDFLAIKQLIENVIRENDADVFMEHIASVLSEVTDLIGVTMTPLFESGVFDRIEIVNIGGSRYLLVISLKSGLVKTINLTVDKVIPRTKTEETARLLTNRLHGLTVSDIKKTMGKLLKGISGGDRKLFDVILNKRELIFNFSVGNDIHIAGLSRLLSNPDFSSNEYSHKLVDLFEHKQEIADALKQTVIDIDSDVVNINIGGNGLWGTNPPLSLVSATYHSGNIPGIVAVIGPTRIYYPRLWAVIKYTASVTSNFFSS